MDSNYDNDETSSTNRDVNSGESAVQGGGDDIVNEQEQNKPTNQEEFIDDTTPNNKFTNSPQTGLPEAEEQGNNKAGGNAKGDEPLIPEVGDDPDETGKKTPTMKE